MIVGTANSLARHPSAIFGGRSVNPRASTLRARAARYRRLRDSILDERTRLALEQAAREAELEAERVEAEPDPARAAPKSDDAE